VEESVNRRVFENLPVTVSYHKATTDMGLRKASQREGTLRVVSIGDLDRSACGGTHVRSTGEIGPVLIRKLDKIRGNVRIEFVCGMRAVHRARTDYDLLSRVARVFSSTLEDAADLAASQAERLAESEKARRKLWLEGASSRGRQLYVQTVPGGGGVRVHERKERSASDALRVEAQAFVAEGSAVFLALIDEPPSLLLAASQDSTIVAGAVLKPLLEGCGGRGGGNAQVAQGSVPDIISRDAVAEKLRQLVR
jgi:alanyl-tRNA synthetase